MARSGSSEPRACASPRGCRYGIGSVFDAGIDDAGGRALTTGAPVPVLAECDTVRQRSVGHYPHRNSALIGLRKC